MRKSHKNKKHNYIVFTFILIAVCVALLSIGWSAFQSTFNISNLVATIRLDRDVRISGARVLSVTSSAVSNYEEYNISNVYTSVSLPNANSTATYEVTVTNLGNTEAGIKNITGLPSNLTYTLQNYTLEDVMCDDINNSKCKLGSVTSILITIGYAENGYNSNTTTYVLNLDFEFMSVEWVAKIGSNRYFETLQKAVEAVSTDGTLTTIQLLKNTTEYVEVQNNRNITLDLQNYTINSATINGTTMPVIEIFSGIIRMSNGSIYSNASQAAVNVHNGGQFYMSGGNILSEGSKQALYNNGGIVTISGTSSLRNTNNQRAAVQNNDAAGTLTITGGTIISDKHSAVQNVAGTLVIGTNDGTISTTVPVLQGGTYAVNNSNVITSNLPSTITITNFSIYDGVLKGKTAVVYDETQSTKPSGYGFLRRTESIGNATYQTAILSIVNKVTFAANGGTCSEGDRGVETGKAIGVLPIPTRTSYVFDGWYYDNGTQATKDDLVYTDFTLTARWTHVDDSYVAQIGTTKYHTLTNAISAAPSNTETTITLIKDTIENVTINNDKRITLDLQTFTISSANNSAVIVNKGRCTLVSGTITTASTNTAAINNTGTFLMTGGKIEATGQRQAIYNDGGSVTISGTAELSATTSIRATVQNHTAGGTITILGGTIISPNYSAVVNEAGTVTLGDDDGTIDATTPILRGKTYGIQNSATFNFYDGKLMGKSGRNTGSITNHVGSYVDTTETIGSDTYYVRYLN